MSLRILLLPVLLACSAASHAVVVERALTSGPTSYCQSALPVFDGNIRKRPLGVVNEGTGTAFVTCSFPMQGTNSGYRLDLWASSTNATATTLTCTGVGGYQGLSTAVTKTVTLPTSGGQLSIQFLATNLPNAPTYFPSGFFSVSCGLAPGVALHDSYLQIREDIGA